MDINAAPDASEEKVAELMVDAVKKTRKRCAMAMHVFIMNHIRGDKQIESFGQYVRVQNPLDDIVIDSCNISFGAYKYWESALHIRHENVVFTIPAEPEVEAQILTLPTINFSNLFSLSSGHTVYIDFQTHDGPHLCDIGMLGYENNISDLWNFISERPDATLEELRAFMRDVLGFILQG